MTLAVEHSKVHGHGCLEEPPHIRTMRQAAGPRMSMTGSSAPTVLGRIRPLKRTGAYRIVQIGVNFPITKGIILPL